MNVKCEQIDDLLLEGDGFSLETARQHAASCAACRETLDDWDDISGVARTMRTTWQNDTLWPRIARALKSEQRRSTMRVWQIAAAVMIFTALGAIVWYAQVRTRQHEFDQAILRGKAVDQVEQAEKAHLAAIEQLEKVADPKLQRDDSPLMVSYREKLLLLDDAIAECQTNIKVNRQNAHLRRQLLAMYSDKQRTLQDVLREDPNESR